MESFVASSLRHSGSPGSTSLRESMSEKDEILLDFVASEQVINQQRTRKPVCCEGLSLSFIIWLVMTFRIGVALLLASGEKQKRRFIRCCLFVK
jgi:hypothetical protein